MAKTQNKTEPEVCTYIDVDENSLTVEIVLPGVPRENIRLKVNPRALVLNATYEGVSYAKYVVFKLPVIPEKGRACFEHGLLRIKIPLRA
jgi:HSP20 family molecular chaperone IbpA